MSGHEGRLRAGPRRRLRFTSDERLLAHVRRGDATAFEILYDRHCGELLSFCRYMLGSPHDAEDAVQATFASAHRALLADERAVSVRPWLFAIARNASLSILRQRRPEGAIDGALAHRQDLAAQVEQREDLRQMLQTVLELPERQRTALLLAELHGLSQAEIGALLGVRTEQVKSYVFQARSSLLSERRARSADCREIREELATARGAALLRGHLRRHLRSCPGCRDYADALSLQRHRLGALLPVAPSLALKRRALEAALGKSGGAAGYGSGLAGTSLAGGAGELAGVGVKAVLVKALAGAACLGLGTGVGVGANLLLPPSTPPEHAAAPSRGRVASLQLAASVRPVQAAGRDGTAPPPAPGAARSVAGAQPSQVVPAADAKPVLRAPAGPGGGNLAKTDPVVGLVHGRSEGAHRTGAEGQGSIAHEPHAKGEAPARGASEEAHGNSREPHGNAVGEAARGKSAEAHGNSAEPHGNSEEAHGPPASEAARGKSAEAHGNSAGEQAHGNAEAAHESGAEPHGQSEAPHGGSEEAHGPAS